MQLEYGSRHPSGRQDPRGGRHRLGAAGVPCSICDKTFSSYGNMFRHCRHIHSVVQCDDSASVASTAFNNDHTSKGPEADRLQPGVGVWSLNANSRHIDVCVERLYQRVDEEQQEREEYEAKWPESTSMDFPPMDVSLPQFYAGLADNVAENLSTYLDGGAESIKQARRYIKPVDYVQLCDSFSIVPKPSSVHWTHYNLPAFFEPVDPVMLNQSSDQLFLSPVLPEIGRPVYSTCPLPVKREGGCKGEEPTSVLHLYGDDNVVSRSLLSSDCPAEAECDPDPALASFTCQLIERADNLSCLHHAGSMMEKRSSTDVTGHLILQHVGTCGSCSPFITTGRMSDVLVNGDVAESKCRAECGDRILMKDDSARFSGHQTELQCCGETPVGGEQPFEWTCGDKSVYGERHIDLPLGHIPVDGQARTVLTSGNSSLDSELVSALLCRNGCAEQTFDFPGGGKFSDGTLEHVDSVVCSSDSFIGESLVTSVLNGECIHSDILSGSLRTEHSFLSYRKTGVDTLPARTAVDGLEVSLPVFCSTISSLCSVKEDTKLQMNGDGDSLEATSPSVAEHLGTVGHCVSAEQSIGGCYADKCCIDRQVCREGSSESNRHVCREGCSESSRQVCREGSSESNRQVCREGSSESNRQVCMEGSSESNRQVCSSESNRQVCREGSSESNRQVCREDSSESNRQVCREDSSESNRQVCREGSSESNRQVCREGSNESNRHVCREGSSESNRQVCREGSSESNRQVCREGSSESNRQVCREGSSESNRQVCSSESNRQVCKEGSSESNRQVCREDSSESNRQVCREDSSESNRQVCREGSSESNRQVCREGSNESNRQVCREGSSESNRQVCREGSSESNIQVCREGSSESNRQVCREGSSESNRQVCSSESNRQVCREGSSESNRQVCSSESNRQVCREGSSESNRQVCREGSSESNRQVCSSESNRQVCREGSSESNRQVCREGSSESNIQVCREGSSESNRQVCSSESNRQVCREGSNESNRQVCREDSSESNRQVCREDSSESNRQVCREGSSESNRQVCREGSNESNRQVCSSESNRQVCREGSNESNRQVCSSESNRQVCREGSNESNRQVCREGSSESNRQVCREDSSESNRQVCREGSSESNRQVCREGSNESNRQVCSSESNRQVCREGSNESNRQVCSSESNRQVCREGSNESNRQVCREGSSESNRQVCREGSNESNRQVCREGSSESKHGLAVVNCHSDWHCLHDFVHCNGVYDEGFTVGTPIFVHNPLTLSNVSDISRSHEKEHENMDDVSELEKVDAERTLRTNDMRAHHLTGSQVAGLDDRNVGMLEHCSDLGACRSLRYGDCRCTDADYQSRCSGVFGMNEELLSRWEWIDEVMFMLRLELRVAKGASESGMHISVGCRIANPSVLGRSTNDRSQADDVEHECCQKPPSHNMDISSVCAAVATCSADVRCNPIGCFLMCGSSYGYHIDRSVPVRHHQHPTEKADSPRTDRGMYSKMTILSNTHDVQDRYGTTNIKYLLPFSHQICPAKGLDWVTPSELGAADFLQMKFGRHRSVYAVCSFCRRYFHGVESLLRHQMKKHPLIRCSYFEVRSTVQLV